MHQSSSKAEWVTYIPEELLLGLVLPCHVQEVLHFEDLDDVIYLHPNVFDGFDHCDHDRHLLIFQQIQIVLKEMILEVLL
jgi:hypothetical protein